MADTRPWEPRDGRQFRAAVVGAGSWGTAFACHLARCGVATTLLARRVEQAEAIARDHRNPDYLNALQLPPELGTGVYASWDFSAVDLVVMAVPSKAYAAVVTLLADRLPADLAVLSLTKGVDPGTLHRLSQVLEEGWAAWRPRVAVLSGPNHAEEVSLGQPTATVIASHDDDLVARLRDILSTDTFRVYSNNDLIGVEFAAAVKNIIAIASGMCDGVGYGDNARAALLTRGLAEMSRLGSALGADALTFSGLAGMGDLVATCTSSHSRNRRAGELIARGRSPAEVEGEMGMVAEGMTAAPAILRLAGEHGIEMPITENVVAVLSGSKDITAAVRDLMGRQPRPERH